MSITIDLDQTEQKALLEIANRRGLSPEAYAKSELRNALLRERQFEAITDYVLTKNEELHRRLAK